MKNKQMKLMVSEEEKIFWRKISHKYEMNLSEFIRYCVNKEIISSEEKRGLK